MSRSFFIFCAALALYATPAFAQDAPPNPATTPDQTSAPPRAPTPATPPAGQISDEDIQNLFDAWDADDNGSISLAEWLAAGRQESGFRQVDTDRNQVVTLIELRAAIAAMQSGG